MIGLQEMNLAFNYPILFWNCANIIVDSMATDLITKDEDEIGYIEDSENYDDGNEDEEERSSSPVEYGKIAKAIGKMASYGVTIHLPDINKSRLTFSPSVEDNSIYYGIKGISKINDKITEEIILNRPYYSVDDFFNKVKVNKPQAINLIKSGAFDAFGGREKIMRDYILSISDTKTDLNLRNMQMLMTCGLLPDSLDFERRVFNFNKYLKKSTFGEEYYLDNTAYLFYEKHFNIDLINFFEHETYIGSIGKKDWNKIYNKTMDRVRDHIKSNKEKLLEELNWLLTKDVWEKYAVGSLSKWEMDSVSFYHHEHELAHVPKDVYDISNFFDLNEKPEEEYSFTTKEGFTVRINKLYRITGTVLAKDKAKHSVTILTEDGVVNVKVWNNQFAKYDKQISEKQADGKKKILEKSWFSRGNKLIFTGIRRGADFIPKVYKNSEWKNPIQLITSIDEQGFLELKSERDGEQ